MTTAEIAAQWADQMHRGTLRVLDGGRLAPSDASTVVDCTGRRARIIRPGALPAALLRTCVADLLGDT